MSHDAHHAVPAPYTGKVSPGGTPQHRVLPHLIISKMSVGPMDNNTYLLTCRSTGSAILIDAAHDGDRILGMLQQVGEDLQARWAVESTARATPPLTLHGIVTTHQHSDHWQALAQVADATNAIVYSSPEDAPGLPIAVDVPLVHGDTVPLGGQHLTVIALRGHTPGSIALHYGNSDAHPQHHIFTGDSLFPGGVGRTTSPADFVSLIDDVETRVFAAYDDDTWVYPGHGNDTTLGAERPHLDEWRARGW